ncbi:type 4a pilus biogenesis protein PilO [Candidatus Gottesmanbacteria bacterium]|nr:type 4a pilus biogenesis protein PilO [Candidatus Gottesmanbacteria bacterium]
MEIEKQNYKTYVTRYRKYYAQNVVPFIKSKHATAYSMIILSLFTISFFGMFAIRPTLTTITELKRQIDDSKQLNEALQNKINQVIAAQEQYQLIKDFVPAINNALPNRPELASLLRDIENIASEKGATLSAIQVNSITYLPQSTQSGSLQTVAENEQPIIIDMTIKLNGTYEQTSAFLQKLLSIRRTVTAQTMELAASSEEASLNLVLKLNGYYLK